MAGHFVYKEGDILGPYKMTLLKRTSRTKGGKWKGIFQCTYKDCVYWDKCDKKYEVEISLVVSGKHYKCGKGNRKTPLSKQELDLVSTDVKDIKNKPKRRRFKYNSGDKIGPYAITLLERLYKQKSRWYASFQCPYCGENFIAAIHDVQDGSSRSCGCLENSTKSWSGGDIKWSDGDKIGPYGITLFKRLDEKDEHNKPLGIFECPYYGINSKCNHFFIVPIERVSNGITSSCGCKKISHGEEKIISILQELGLDYKYQHIFEDCRNPETNRALRFDFYLPVYNCCIEYDGQQHFLDFVQKYSGGWNSLENYKQCHKRDVLKNIYCNENNIKLIRIPYYDYPKLNCEYILDRIGE